MVYEDFAGFGAKVLDFVLLELDGFSRSVSPHYKGVETFGADELVSLEYGHSPSNNRSITESRSISVV